MRHRISILALILLLIFSVLISVGCGVDTSTLAGSATELNSTESEQEDSKRVVEPLIDQVEGLSMIRSYFLSINENQSCSELKEIAESCGFNARTQYSGSELEVFGDGEVVNIEFREDTVYEAWIKLSTNRWDIQFSPYGKAIKDGEMVDVQFYEVCFGNTLDERNQRFDLDQGKEAFEYAESLDPIN